MLEPKNCRNCKKSVLLNGSTFYCSPECAYAGKQKAWREAHRRNYVRKSPPNRPKTAKSLRNEELRWAREEGARRGVPRWQILKEIGARYDNIHD